MKVKVIGKTGVRSGEFEGRPWQHKKLFATFEDKTVDDLQGNMCEVFKVPVNVEIPVQPGEFAEISFNRRGKIERIVKVS